MRRLGLAAALLAFGAIPAAGQHSGHHHPAPAAAPPQGYAGLETRRVKALSAEQEADLLAGRGMSLALAAELNAYPGPLHVLELADALGLRPEQREAAEALRARVAAEARLLGARLVQAEAELDRLFAAAQADPASLAALTATIGALQGRLREVHLAAHIEMRAALTEVQRETYARLRGYRR